jgi:hypothetical protein
VRSKALLADVPALLAQGDVAQKGRSEVNHKGWFATPLEPPSRSGFAPGSAPKWLTPKLLDRRPNTLRGAVIAHKTVLGLSSSPKPCQKPVGVRAGYLC